LADKHADRLSWERVLPCWNSQCMGSVHKTLSRLHVFQTLLNLDLDVGVGKNRDVDGDCN